VTETTNYVPEWSNSRYSRRTVLTGLGATIGGPLLVCRAAAASLMNPATAEVRFQHEAPDTVLRFSFVEFLWRDDNGKIDCHLELDTKPFGTLSRQGVFRKGGASGPFYVSFGAALPATNRKFWWPPGATSQQPPLKGGQNRGGQVVRWQGIARNSFTAGYTSLSPSPQNVNGDMRLYFELNGPGKVPARLGAEHFIPHGEVRIFTDFGYMTAQ
jgi:hypothetical protein